MSNGSPQLPLFNGKVPMSSHEMGWVNVFIRKSILTPGSHYSDYQSPLYLWFLLILPCLQKACSGPIPSCVYPFLITFTKLYPLLCLPPSVPIFMTLSSEPPFYTVLPTKVTLWLCHGYKWHFSLDGHSRDSILLLQQGSALAGES